MKRKEIISALKKFIDTLDVRDGDTASAHAEYGKEEIPSDSLFREFRPNRTMTLTVKVNGGARDW